MHGAGTGHRPPVPATDHRRPQHRRPGRAGPPGRVGSSTPSGSSSSGVCRLTPCAPGLPGLALRPRAGRAQGAGCSRPRGAGRDGQTARPQKLRNRVWSSASAEGVDLGRKAARCRGWLLAQRNEELLRPSTPPPGRATRPGPWRGPGPRCGRAGRCTPCAPPVTRRTARRTFLPRPSTHGPCRPTPSPSARLASRHCSRQVAFGVHCDRLRTVESCDHPALDPDHVGDQIADRPVRSTVSEPSTGQASPRRAGT